MKYEKATDPNCIKYAGPKKLLYPYCNGTAVEIAVKI